MLRVLRIRHAIYHDTQPLRVRVLSMIAALVLAPLVVFYGWAVMPTPTTTSEESVVLYTVLTVLSVGTILAYLIGNQALKLARAFEIQNRRKALSAASKGRFHYLGTYKLAIRPHLTTTYKLSEALVMAFEHNLRTFATFPDGGVTEVTWQKGRPLGTWYRIGGKVLYWAKPVESYLDPHNHPVIVFELLMY